MLAVHSYERILRLGEEDDLYVCVPSFLAPNRDPDASRLHSKYFGNASSAAASGFYAQIAYGNKPASVLLRCDNPDGNCNEVTAAGRELISLFARCEEAADTLPSAAWAGHHRGNNATQETVICPPTCRSILLLPRRVRIPLISVRRHQPSSPQQPLLGRTGDRRRRRCVLDRNRPQCVLHSLLRERELTLLSSAPHDCASPPVVALPVTDIFLGSTFPPSAGTTSITLKTRTPAFSSSLPLGAPTPS